MIRLGVHYEYPFGGMAQREEWLPRGPADWRRDCEMIRGYGLQPYPDKDRAGLEARRGGGAS